MTAPKTIYIEAARRFAMLSPCLKSKRGAVVVDDDTIWGGGCNARPFIGSSCDGSPTCRRDCGKICAHAEQRAIRDALINRRHQGLSNPVLRGLELVHVKVVNGAVVAGGGPSCWQCARDIADVGLEAVWLYQNMWTPTDTAALPQWRRWSTPDFLATTLQNEKLHPYVEHGIRIGALYECRCGYQPSSEDDLANHIAAEGIA